MTYRERKIAELDALAVKWAPALGGDVAKVWKTLRAADAAAYYEANKDGDPAYRASMDLCATADLIRRAANRAAMLTKKAAKAKALGLSVCDHCGGFGGHRTWPGWVCYECGGQGVK